MLVGHSHYFREMVRLRPRAAPSDAKFDVIAIDLSWVPAFALRRQVRHFCAEGCVALDAVGTPIAASDLAAKKLSNAGLARCELDWAASEDKPICELRLLFGTELVS